MKLQRQGREFVGLSPFNNEKTPSFTVNDQKGFYHCFSSGKHGDIISFVMEVEGLAFHEAVERLAQEAGMDVPQPTREGREREERSKGLRDVVELAAGFFRDYLRTRSGDDARDYLKRRGLDQATIERFGLGYAPGSRMSLMDFLAKRDITPAQMAEAGMIISGEDIAKPYDRFRDRIIFPIEDSRGRVIAFGGRAMKADAPAKYLNSPETPLFHKGKSLYNFSRARKAAHDSGSIIVVEGYMDVIALAEAGFDNVVAPLGTALTEDQIQLLWRLAPEPILCFDGDRAGIAAAFRALERILPELRPGFSVRFALLPSGQDPDDLVRAGGAGAFNEILSAAVPLVDMVWQRELDRSPAETPEQRAGFETRLDQRVRDIRDTKVRGYYKSAFDRKLAETFAAAPVRGQQSRYQRADRRAGGSFKATPQPLPMIAKRSRSALGRGQEGARREALLVYLALNHPGLMEESAEVFAEITFANQELDRLRREIIDFAATTSTLDRTNLKDHLTRRGLGEAVERLIHQPGLKAERFAQPEADIQRVEAGWAEVLARHRLVVLEGELALAETAFGKDMTEANDARLKEIKREMEILAGVGLALEGSDGLDNQW